MSLLSPSTMDGGELVGLEPMGYLCNLPIKNNGSSKNKFLVNNLKEMIEFANTNSFLYENFPCLV